MINFLFLGFCLLAVFFSLLIIISKNPIHSILYLILVFCCVSFIFLLLGVEFISIIFLIVYVGAIAVLFLFVVMMLNIKILELDETFWKYAPVGLVIVSLFLFELIFIIFPFNLTDLFNFFGTCSFFEIKNIVINDYTQFIFVIFNDAFNFNFSYNFYDNTTLIGWVLYTYNFYIFFLISLILFVALLGSIVLVLNQNTNIKRQLIFKQTARLLTDSISLKNLN